MDDIRAEMEQTLERISSEIKANVDHAKLVDGSMHVIEKVRQRCMTMIKEAKQERTEEVLAIIDEEFAKFEREVVTSDHLYIVLKSSVMISEKE